MQKNDTNFFQMDKQRIEHITSMQINELSESLRNGSISAEEALKAFTLKAVEVTEATNCVTQFMYEDSLNIAKSLDNLPACERKPLHGLPFSIKEHFELRNLESTVGLYTRIGKKAAENAELGEPAPTFDHFKL